MANHQDFSIINPAEIANTYERIKNYIHKTPIITSSLLNNKLGHQIYFKAEMLQKTGAFKIRGAMNKLLTLKENNQLPKAVSAFSSGNHAQGLALAANILGIKSIIFFPENVSPIKLQATKAYGAEVIMVKTRKEAEEKAALMEKDDIKFIHAYSDDDIILGQGTACFEAIRQIKEDYSAELDAIFVPCGGGGLTSGTFLAKSLLSQKTKLFAAEPLLANDATTSYKTGKIFKFNDTPQTIADGVRTLAISERTFYYLKQLDDFIEISEEEIINWTYLLIHTLKLVTEPTSALAMAAAYKWLQTQPTPQKILIILSGGNIDPTTTKYIMDNYQNIMI